MGWLRLVLTLPCQRWAGTGVLHRRCNVVIGVLMAAGTSALQFSCSR